MCLCIHLIIDYNTERIKFHWEDGFDEPSRAEQLNKIAEFVYKTGKTLSEIDSLKEGDLAERQAGIERGEPNAINPLYAGRDTNLGGEDYVYFYPEPMDMGRVKVSHENNDWVFQWEDRRY